VPTTIIFVRLYSNITSITLAHIYIYLNIFTLIFSLQFNIFIITSCILDCLTIFHDYISCLKQIVLIKRFNTPSSCINYLLTLWITLVFIKLYMSWHTHILLALHYIINYPWNKKKTLYHISQALQLLFLISYFIKKNPTFTCINKISFQNISLGKQQV